MTSGPGATRPAMAGMYPDPTICRVGDDFWVAHSSFEYSPGIPIWHSRDLLTWRHVGNALDRDDQSVAGAAPAGGGIYAPTLRHHDGRFWLITTDVDAADGGQVVFHAETPQGAWSPAIRLTDLRGIDPDLVWDDDGVCLVSFCYWDDDGIVIKQAAVDLEAGRLLEEPRRLWRGTGLGNTEGPHLYRRGGWWYLLVAEGGTDRGHVVSVARSRDPRGPFEGFPGNPVLTHRSTRHPVQSVGHADLVELADGSWAAVYLGTRPRGRTPRFHVNGRETFLAAVRWEDDWPVFDEGALVPHEQPGDVDDDFSRLPEWHPRWISAGARLTDCTVPVRDGVLLRHVPVPSGESTGLFTRAVHAHWSARVELTAGTGAAVAGVRVDARHWYGLRVTADEVQAVSHVGEIEHVVRTVPSPAGRPVVAHVASRPATAGGPDDIELSLETGDGRVVLASLDGRYLSTEVAGGFTGRVLGVWAEAGEVTVHRITYGADPA